MMDLEANRGTSADDSRNNRDNSKRLICDNCRNATRIKSRTNMTDELRTIESIIVNNRTGTSTCSSLPHACPQNLGIPENRLGAIQPKEEK